MALLDAMRRRSSSRASMRPRRVRLGWAIARGPRGDAVERFNEAEARTPRMGRDLLRTGARRRARFNEAEARTPRMDERGLDVPIAPCGASMRPRRVRLGWAASRDGERRATIWLQ